MMCSPMTIVTFLLTVISAAFLWVSTFTFSWYTLSSNGGIQFDSGYGLFGSCDGTSCTISTDNLTSTETALVVLSCLAIVFQALAIIAMVLGLCGNGAGAAARFLVGISACLYTSVLIIFPSQFDSWAIPAGYKMGWSYILAIIGTVFCWIVAMMPDSATSAPAKRVEYV